MSHDLPLLSYSPGFIYETWKDGTPLIVGINKNTFTKLDFDRLSKVNSVEIKKINLENQNDSENLDLGAVNAIYKYTEKKIVVVNDIGFSQNYLVYIHKIQNAKIDIASEEYQKYLNLSKIKIVNDLYNTYDNYLKNKYEIDINYQALDTVKNYFN